MRRLHSQLESIVGRDQDQEVRGIALPIIDAVIGAARENMLLDDPVMLSCPI